MCDQTPDELILDGRKVAIEPLPVKETFEISYSPEMAMPITTGHMREYVAYWELTDQGLYLIGSMGCYQLNPSKRVFADWITAIIRPAIGSYGEHFEIHIANGIVVDCES